MSRALEAHTHVLILFSGSHGLLTAIPGSGLSGITLMLDLTHRIRNRKDRLLCEELVIKHLPTYHTKAGTPVGYNKLSRSVGGVFLHRHF